MTTELECSICLNNISSRVQDFVTTHCNHCFHASCLISCAIHNGYSCPMCCTNMTNPLVAIPLVDLTVEEDMSDDEIPLINPLPRYVDNLGRTLIDTHSLEDENEDEDEVTKIYVDTRVFEDRLVLVCLASDTVFDYYDYVDYGEIKSIGTWDWNNNAILREVV